MAMLKGAHMGERMSGDLGTILIFETEDRSGWTWEAIMSDGVTVGKLYERPSQASKAVVRFLKARGITSMTYDRMYDSCFTRQMIPRLQISVTSRAGTPAPSEG